MFGQKVMRVKSLDKMMSCPVNERSFCPGSMASTYILRTNCLPIVRRREKEVRHNYTGHSFCLRRRSKATAIVSEAARSGKKQPGLTETLPTVDRMLTMEE